MENTNNIPAPSMNQVASILTACANTYTPSLKAKTQLDNIIAFGTSLGFDMGLVSELRNDILTKVGAITGKIKHTGQGAKASATLNISEAIKAMDLDADTLKLVKKQFSRVAKLLALMNDASYNHNIKFGSDSDKE